MAKPCFVIVKSLVVKCKKSSLRSSKIQKLSGSEPPIYYPLCLTKNMRELMIMAFESINIFFCVHVVCPPALATTIPDEETTNYKTAVPTLN